MQPEHVGALIKRLRSERGLTQGQLATYAQVTRSWLSLVELGRRERPEREMLERVASVLRVPPETLLAAAGYRVTPVPPRKQRTPQEIIRELEATMREAPIMVEVLPQPVSAGAGAPEVESVPFWPKPGERNHVYKAVEVVGECMEPRIMRGHFVIVDLNAEPRAGDVVVAQDDGEYLVKILEQRNGDLYLVAVQPQPPIKVTERTRIVGVVKGAHYTP